MTPFEEETGCSVNVKIGNTSDEMVPADAERRVRRGVGVGRRHAPAHRRRRGGAGQHRPHPELRGCLRRPEGPAATTRSTACPTACPTAGAPTCSCTTPKTFTAAPDSWGVMFDADSPAKGGVSVYDSPDLHRRRRAVPDGHPARSRHREPVRARRDPVRRRPSTCSNQQKDLAGQYWSLYTDQQAALEAGSVTAGTTWQVIVNLAQGNGAKIDAVKPDGGRHGLVRHVDDLQQGRSTPTACTCG